MGQGLTESDLTKNELLKRFGDCGSCRHRIGREERKKRKKRKRRASSQWRAKRQKRIWPDGMLGNVKTSGNGITRRRKDQYDT